ncbi:MAG: ACP S-malonyltransferase [Gemmatimonadota bacterium]|nr:ACP S-malonyltransferase [Gemmatimonadota bacterium]
MRIALMMPGQGSQAVGMGRDLADADAAVRELYARADEILGVPLSRFCFEGPEETLTRTENAQPAILLHSWATWTSLPDGIRDAVVVGAGHSLGEFSACLAAGALRFEDALRLVRRRGELMARAGEERPGTMAALLGLSVAEVTAVCEAASGPAGVVVPANFNAPDQVVVSGDVAAVEAAREEALAAGARRAVRLNVSGAFHSPLMARAREGLQAALADVEVVDPAFPVVANASARPVRTGREIREQLVRQLTSPVRWVESVAAMRDESPGAWLELGPGRVLAGLLRRMDRSLPAHAAGDVEEIAVLEEALDV